MNPTDPEIAQSIREFEPFVTLPRETQDELIRGASIVEFAPGDNVFVEGDVDDFVNYVLEGLAEWFRKGRHVGWVDTRSQARLHPLDAAGPKRHTLVAQSRLRVLRLMRSAVERAVAVQARQPSGEALEVSEIETDHSDDWMTRYLRSAVFRRLSAPTIQAVFARMESIEALAGEAIVRQGETPDYYYVIQSGHCEVRRQPVSGRQAVQLGVLGPGDGFGEESILSGEPRNATVTMLTDGQLMRLDRHDFLELLARPLVYGVSYRQACWMVEQGATWIDTRNAESYLESHFDGALNIPHEMLRIQCRRLNSEASYVVCSTSPKSGLLGAFLMAERGLDVCYLDESMSEHLKPDPPKTPESTEPEAGLASADDSRTEPPVSVIPAQRPEPLPRSEYADTMVGMELADLIEELDDRQQGLSESTGPEAEVVQPPEGPAPMESEPPVTSSTDDPLLATPPPELDEDELAAILLNTDERLRQYVTRTIEANRAALERKLASRVAEIKRSAGQVLRERAEQLQKRYAQAHAEKERSLRSDYERLMGLASKMSHQKAEIQRTRKDLESKLKDVDRLYREVAQIGGSLIDQFDELDGITPGHPPGERRH